MSSTTIGQNSTSFSVTFDFSKLSSCQEVQQEAQEQSVSDGLIEENADMLPHLCYSGCFTGLYKNYYDDKEGMLANLAKHYPDNDLKMKFVYLGRADDLSDRPLREVTVYDFIFQPESTAPFTLKLDPPENKYATIADPDSMTEEEKEGALKWESALFSITEGEVSQAVAQSINRTGGVRRFKNITYDFDPSEKTFVVKDFYYEKEPCLTTFWRSLPNFMGGGRVHQDVFKYLEKAKEEEEEKNGPLKIYLSNKKES